MASWTALFLFCLAVFRTVRADAPSLVDVLNNYTELSSFQNLLTTQFPDLLQQLGAANASSPITICAPSNDAFGKVQYSSAIGPAFANNVSSVIGNILNYHVIPGEHISSSLGPNFQFLPTLLTDPTLENVSGGQRVSMVLQGGFPPQIVLVSGLSSRSVVSTSDIPFSGGYVQIIDTFLNPPQPFVDTTEAFGSNIMTGLTSFLGAVYSLPDMAIANYLNNSQNVTVFVPNNIAFETVGGALYEMSQSTLEEVLAYHIFTSTEPLYSSNFTNGTVLSTASNTNLRFTFEDNSLFVNSARVLQSDLLISNGVMHIIDNVLDPNATTAAPNPTFPTQMPVLPTTVGTYNMSSAPFTTFIPSFTATADSGDATATSGDGNAGLTSRTTSAGASPTSTKKSSAAPRYPRLGQEPMLPMPALVAGLACGALCVF